MVGRAGCRPNRDSRAVVGDVTVRNPVTPALPPGRSPRVMRDFRVVTLTTGQLRDWLMRAHYAERHITMREAETAFDTMIDQEWYRQQSEMPPS